MDRTVTDYLSSQRVGCLAVAGPDGRVYGSTVHFASTEVGKLFIQIGTDSRKYQAVKNGPCSASFTVGFSEEEWKTLQLDGELRQIEPEQDKEFQEVYYRKNPQAKKYRGDDTAYLLFTPSWWRYSDFSVGDPPKVISSN